MKPRKCVWCGEEFIPNSPKQTSCKADHYRPCAICGQPLLIKESYQNYLKYGPRTCPDCRKIAISRSHIARSDADKHTAAEKRKQTNLQRYGVEYAMQSESISNKVHQTVKDRYGVDNVSQLPDVQAKIRANSLDRYGVNHYAQDSTIQARMHEGMLSKYGAASPMQVPELKARIAETNLSRYGTSCVFSSQVIQDKIKQTCLERYGVETIGQAQEVIEKRMQTNFRKYGAPGYIFSDEYLASLMTDPSKAAVAAQFRSDPETFILANYDSKPTYHQLAQDTGLHETSVSYHVCKNNLQNLIQYTLSRMEDEVVDFLCSVDADLNIIRHDHSVLGKQELDIYLPDYKLAIECNPAASHNSDVPFIAGDPVNTVYHRNKSQCAAVHDVFVFQLFGYCWVNHRDVVQSMLRNLIQHPQFRIYARNCVVQEVSSSEATSFLSSNHLQGSTSGAKVRIGLYHQGELVSVMTFGKLRPTFGKTSETPVWELSRFCSKLDTSIVGGASKLFKYFIDRYCPQQIVSFSDVATTRGGLYSTLGFTKVGVSDPGYVWVDPRTESYLTRGRTQKSNLRKLFDDNTIDIDALSERQIMLQHGYVSVWDCGKIRWMWVSSHAK